MVILRSMPPVVTAALAFCLLTGPPSAMGPLSQEGGASFYGREFEGRATASGERFSNGALTAASRTLPFGTWVMVTRLDTGDTVIVRINDRGPFVRGRIIDLSRRAAEDIHMVARGVARVRVDVIPAPVEEIPRLLALVRRLVGDLPGPGETVGILHGALPAGTEGMLDIVPDDGTSETVTLAFRVVGRVRRPPAEAVTVHGGRERRSARLRALAPPVFPEETLPATEPVVIYPAGTPTVIEPGFPTPNLAPGATGASVPGAVSYPAAP